MLFANLRWKNQMNTEEEIRIYKDIKPIDLNNLPPILTALPPGSSHYKDEDVVNNQKYFYAVSSLRQGVEKISRILSFTPTALDLGPGPQTLVGNNDTAGFFGEVPTSQLINGDGLAAMLGLTAGTSQNSTSPWLKFFIDDKIYYVAKKNYRHSVSWDHINAVNAVYGDRIIEIGGYRFRVGLLGGSNPDTSVPWTTGYDVSSSHGSEWNRLMYNVSDNAIASDIRDSQVGDNWANYPQTDVADGLNIAAGNGRYGWCKETNPASPTTRVVRGSGAVSYFYIVTSSNSNATYGWRPRLELITQ